GDAEAGGDRHLLVAGVEREALQGAVDPLAHAQRAFRLGLREDDRELVAAVASRYVRRAQRARDLGADGAKEAVADDVSKAIVHSFEPVEIDHRERQRPAVAIDAVHLLPDAIDEVPAVVESREWI